MPHRRSPGTGSPLNCSPTQEWPTHGRLAAGRSGALTGPEVLARIPLHHQRPRTWQANRIELRRAQVHGAGNRPLDLAQMVLLPMFAEFIRPNPGVSIEVQRCAIDVKGHPCLLWLTRYTPSTRRNDSQTMLHVSPPDSEGRGTSGTFELPVPLTGTELHAKFNRLRERLDGLQRLSDPERLIWADPRPSGRRTIHVPIPPNVPPIVPE